ncbi:DNA-binding MarR family transcriptional regulator [Barrientosiimonas humi]|uniref:DNA-binding MarR family transcriptional regulator n=1 Tax=Barrientosiimonas humi TaxID=999931 RepID=A0A542XA81_9MICO|nr:winged helix DNA-binding protein [Barrientosiimonas humi]TQL32656.1 DNA-binding MarR family transcriptional regulator [Barrientosiimonas humi]CAG7572647.1 hypothetical protein BH39T_PBIAJDOK_01270 [Barrientosiimonas humi]
MGSTLAYDLHTLVRRLDREADRLLVPLGLSYRRYLTLLLVGELDGGTQRQVAETVDTSEAAMSRMLGALAGEGLVTIAPDAGNGHRKLVRLTADGRDLVDRASATLGDQLDDLVRSLGLDPDRLAAEVRTVREGLGA